MASETVISDSGPIIHLSEIGADFVWSLFETVYIPEVVRKEVSFKDRPGSRIVDTDRYILIPFDEEIYERASKLFSEHSIGKNDATVMATAIHLNADILLTDDLDMRDRAKENGITPVGTLGLLLRAFRKGICDLEILLKIIDKIPQESSLYITRELLEMIKISAMEFQRYRFEE